jgi:uncharacterized protein YpbB
VLFEQILLKMVDRLNEERTISAPYHLLRGKKSGQTIQDVKSYGLTSTFSIFPKLSKTTYDRTIDLMIEKNWMTISNQLIPSLTEEGLEIKKNLPILSLNGWLYRGNDMTFFHRLSLLTQTLSHIGAGNMSYVPVQKDEKIQKWVRTFLFNTPYKSREFRLNFKNELEMCLLAATESELHRQLISYRLSGYEITGLTWQQLAFELKLEPIDIQIRFTEGLHLVLDEIFSNTSYPILRELCKDVRALNPLTESASKSANLYKQGYSINQIAEIRKLKTSTIEDHFVEMAMNDSNFDITSFLENGDIEEVIRGIKNISSNKLKLLKEHFPNYSYFQLRLLLAARGEVDDSSHI